MGKWFQAPSGKGAWWGTVRRTAPEHLFLGLRGVPPTLGEEGGG